MGYAYDPELAPFVELLPTSDLRDVAAARQLTDALVAPVNEGVDTTGVEVVHHEVPGPTGATGAPAVPVVLNRPEGEPPPEGRPALLDLHGGGFVVGSPAMELAFATRVVRAAGAVVVAPDYRLAPEHPFPAGVENCYATLRWMAAEAASLGIDPQRIAMGGQSAGAGSPPRCASWRATEAVRRCASSCSASPSSATGSRPPACAPSPTRPSGTGPTPS